MRSFNFYEFVGVLVPGVLLLFGVGLLFGHAPRLKPILLPSDLGSATVHLIIAYAIGHLVQALGNLIESLYWRARGGMPTDWPFSSPSDNFPTTLRSIVQKATGAASATTLHEWRRSVGAARSLMTAKAMTSRLETFNGNYGMFRGMVAAGTILLAIAWLSRLNLWIVYPVLLIGTGTALYRMNRFALHYGRKFFASVHALLALEGSQTAGSSDGKRSA